MVVPPAMVAPLAMVTGQETVTPPEMIVPPVKSICESYPSDVVARLHALLSMVAQLFTVAPFLHLLH
jgi:hypothetical protein